MKFLPDWYQSQSGGAPSWASYQTHPEQTSHQPGRSGATTLWWELLNTPQSPLTCYLGPHATQFPNRSDAWCSPHLVYRGWHSAHRSPGSSQLGRRSLRWLGLQSDWQTPRWGDWSDTRGCPSRSHPLHIWRTETFKTRWQMLVKSFPITLREFCRWALR